MDGTYGNYLPANSTMSPTAPTTSSGADRYKVNVSRQKTQKWANFKPQNYGDGWGDDDDDEWDEPEPPLPQKPMGPRQPATLPSSSTSSFLPSQAPLRLVTAPSSSTGSLASLPSQSQHSLASPGGSHASPTKPPFVRPAEIYKRMEEEKRQSLEAARPNVATLGGDKTNAPGEPTRYTLSDSEPTTSTGLGENAEVNRALGPGLATVPERRSEYGLEGLLDSYGAEEHRKEPSRGPPLSGSAGTNIQTPQPIQHPDDSQVQAGVELRRFSSSPQLPLVTRLSGFGEDFFSPATFVNDSTQQPAVPNAPKEQIASPAPATSSVWAHSPFSTIQDAGLAPEANAGPEPDKEMPLHVPSDLSKSNAGPIEIDATARSQSPPSQSGRSIGPQDGSTATQPTHNWTTQHQQPTENLRREPASRANIDDKALIRPSLPGGWVTETVETPGEAPEPVQLSSLAITSDADRSRQPSPAILSGANESISTKQEAVPLPRTVPPPVRPSSPTTSNKLDMSRDQQPWEGNASLGNTGSTTKIPQIPASSSIQNRDITPTAPLNPRRDAPEVNTSVQPVLSPPSNGTGSSAEADAHSPLKESDVLSQEIIKSLSPAQSSESFGVINGATTSAYQAAAAAAEHREEEPGRESSYLGDVYDDYWAAGEDKADHAAAGGRETRELAESPPPAYSTQTRTVTPGATPTQTSVPANVLPSTSKNVTPAAPTSTAPTPGDNRRRFSWEAGFSDPATVVTQLTPTPPMAEAKSLGSGLGHGGGSVTSPTIPAAPAIPSLDGSAPSLISCIKSDNAPGSGEISHQVSQASTLAPRSTNTPIEPPSPVSVVSEQQGSRAAPESQQSSAPGPADDQLTSKTLLPRAPSPQNHVNILPFRSILEMSSPVERTKNFDDARYQFAAIDTGLEEWLATMVSMHPEHNNSSFGASREALPSPTGHFQQAGHLSSANIPMPPFQQHGTGFGHLHGSAQVNQVGTKSKELLMAAGKAGKGFFSKGRNKLRGTGDKVFS